MRAFDFTPLLRSSIGFENLNRLADLAARDASAETFPPYNIEKLSQDAYRISMAVAGFSRDELDLTVQENTLIVTGRSAPEAEGEKREFLHRGIAKRAFERRFQLADHVEVKAAHLKNGLLHVDLVRNIPEAMKPRKIEILPAQKNNEPKAIEAQVVTDGETVN